MGIASKPRCLGAGKSRIFWTIEMPLAWRCLMAGGVLARARALGELGATIMIARNIAGQTTTIPVAIYMAVDGGEFQTSQKDVWVLAIINFGFLLFLSFGTRRWSRNSLLQIFLSLTAYLPAGSIVTSYAMAFRVAAPSL